MKKAVLLSAVALFSFATVNAQSQDSRAAAPAKVENKEALKSATKGEAAPVDAKTQLQQVETSIVELERFIKENSGREGFEHEAYAKRLQFLQNRQKELSNTVNSDK